MKVTIQEQRNPKTGNPITVIRGITHNPQVIDKLAKKLKSACGAGGFVDGKTVTVQGSHLKTVEKILMKDGYDVQLK